MSYEISKGLEESELADFVSSALEKYGIYQGNSVNYTDARIAPIVMCTVLYGSELILVKRGYGLADAEGYWSTINGFIDEARPVKEIVIKELKEELGLEVTKNDIRVGKSYTLRNPKEKKAYIVFPCLIIIKGRRPKITLDKEHIDYAWIKRQQLKDFEILDDLPYAIDKALSLKNT